MGDLSSKQLGNGWQFPRRVTFFGLVCRKEWIMRRKDFIWQWMYHASICLYASHMSYVVTYSDIWRCQRAIPNPHLPNGLIAANRQNHELLHEFLLKSLHAHCLATSCNLVQASQSSSPSAGRCGRFGETDKRQQKTAICLRSRLTINTHHMEDLLVLISGS